MQSFTTASSGYDTWLGATSTSWSDGTNWSSGSPPSMTDEVVINGYAANAPTLDLSGGTVTVKALSVGSSATSVLTLSNASATNLLSATNDVGVGSAGAITHTANTTTETRIVNISAANLTVASGGAIDVSGKGYQSGAGPGVGKSGGNGSGGASYGGVGGRGYSNSAGSVYGSLTQPTDLGSGGTSSNAGLGGGAVKLTVSGTTTISGNIKAGGGSYSTQGSGGAGGSVWIITGALAGSGSVSVNGGGGYTNGINEMDGGGSGGRIAVYYTTDSSSITYQAYGGTGWSFGGAGTIYKKASGASYGNLVIDNNSQYSVDDYNNGTTPINDTETFNTLTVQNDGDLVVGSPANITYATLNWSTKGIITDNGGTLALFSSGNAITVPATATLVGNTARTFSGLTVNGTLTHSANATTQVYSLNYTVNGDCTVASGGAIDVSAKGYQQNSGPGAGSWASFYNGSGAGHGGTGGTVGSSTGGGAYDSLSQPVQLGSGGANGYGCIGGAGGGGLLN